MAKPKKSFEAMMDELTQIVSQLEQGELSLDDTLKQYAAGVELVAACRSKLAAAEAVLAPGLEPSEEKPPEQSEKYLKEELDEDPEGKS